MYLTSTVVPFFHHMKHVKVKLVGVHPFKGETPDHISELFKARFKTTKSEKKS
jgi:hypothetical protein